MSSRLLFVLNPALGWKTYAKQLTRVLERRPEVSAHVMLLRPSPWRRTLKHHDMGWKDHLLRHVDPISAYDGWLGRSIRDEIRRLDPRAIHFAAHLPSAAAAFSGIPVPFSVALDCTRFNMNAHHGKAVWSDRELGREADLLGRAARLYPMSRWAAGSLEQDCGVPDQRIRVMPPSTDLGEFTAPVQAGGRPKILFIGNDFLRKGGDRLHRWVTGPLAGSCELHIVSQDPKARVEGENVVHHGRVDHAELMGRLMPRMDIFCLPTRSDMSPQVLTEAAAAGLPTVASDLGGIGDLVLHGRTGFVVPPSDDGAFVARLRELIASPDLRREMSAAARDHARSHLDASRNYDALIDDLIELAG